MPLSAAAHRRQASIQIQKGPRVLRALFVRISRTGLVEGNKVLRRRLTVATVLQIVLDFLTFSQVVQPYLLQCRNMDKGVLRSIFGFNKTESLDAVEPFHGSCRHKSFLHSLCAAEQIRGGVVTALNDVQGVARLSQGDTAFIAASSQTDELYMGTTNEFTREIVAIAGRIAAASSIYAAHRFELPEGGR